MYKVGIADESRNPCASGQVGEIRIRGDSVCQGYWNAPEQTSEAFGTDGWYYTGDLARVDEQGYLYIVGRAKDLIITGGFNVYTAEVEAVVQRHPAVLEVCVFGVPDPTWGEAVHASVTLRPGHDVAAEQLLADLATALAGYKRPKSLTVLPALPRNHNGKIDRKALREPHWIGRTTRVI